MYLFFNKTRTEQIMSESVPRIGELIEIESEIHRVVEVVHTARYDPYIFLGKPEDKQDFFDSIAREFKVFSKWDIYKTKGVTKFFSFEDVKFLNVGEDIFLNYEDDSIQIKRIK